MDPRTDIVTLLRPHGAFSKPITGRGKWGDRYDAQASPSFCIVLEGKRWVFTFTATAYNLVRMRNLMSRAVQSV